MSSFSWADDVEENWDELLFAKKFAEGAAAAAEVAVAEEAAATEEFAAADAGASEHFDWAEDVEKHEEELALEKEKLAETTDQAAAGESVGWADEGEEHAEEVTPATQAVEEHEDTEYFGEAEVYYLSPVEMLGPTGFRLAETWQEADFIDNGHLPPPTCPSKTRSAPSRWSYLNVVQLASDEGEEDEGKDEIDRNLPSTPPPILSFPAADEDEEDEGKDELERNLLPTPPLILPSLVNDDLEDEGKVETDRNDHDPDPETASEVDEAEAAPSPSDFGLAPSVDVPSTLPSTPPPPPPPAILDPPPHRPPRQTPHEYFVATVSGRSSLIIQLLKRLFHQLAG
ncbi:MAG: hypothetical protein Q9187_000321 [Circinaria calcarea]